MRSTEGLSDTYGLAFAKTANGIEVVEYSANRGEQSRKVLSESDVLVDKFPDTKPE